MKKRCLMAIVAACPFLTMAQSDEIALDDIVSAGEQFIKDNLDENVLNALQEGDHLKVQKVFRDLQNSFQGDYVLDLAALKEAALSILPLLESYEETLPYAEWLKIRLDYIDASEELKASAPPPKVEPGKPPVRPPNPSPEVERKVWIKKLEKRPFPSGSEDYAARLKPIFTAQKVPAELVWLAEVESAFNPKARSPAGAVGLFQLMPSTAQNLGLSLRPDDERVSPEKSARAAARYLKELHDKFKDWPLALAAYNAGEGNVQKLLTRHKARTFDAIAIHLPAETQMYVPKIEATLKRREGVSLSQLAKIL
jgi:membrane-bound lytic murein transglycosylase D